MAGATFSKEVRIYDGLRILERGIPFLFMVSFINVFVDLISLLLCFVSPSIWIFLSARVSSALGVLGYVMGAVSCYLPSTT